LRVVTIGGMSGAEMNHSGPPLKPFLKEFPPKKPY